MKKQILCVALLLTLAFLPARAEESIDDMNTVDEQLQYIDVRAAALGVEIEFGGWDEDLSAYAAGDVSYLVPPEIESAVEVSVLPQSMMGKKFVALYDDGTALTIYGDAAARLPAEMRATKQIEADAVLYIRMSLVKSSKTYIPPATSYDRHYDVYAYDLVTGETYRVWSKVNSAKSSGVISQLDGDRIGPEELWYSLRPVLLPRATVESGDVTFTFAVTGAMCCLVGVDAPEGATALDIPAEADGKPVAMIYDCDLARFANLETVVLPDSLAIIADGAFSNVTASTLALPNGVTKIGAYAFQNCDRLTALRLPDGLVSIGNYALADMDSLRAFALPSTVLEIGEFLCNNDFRLARLALGEGVADVPFGIASYCDNLRAIYIPSSATTGLENARIPANVTVCAPAGSYALSWAAENGLISMTCASEAEVPEIASGIEGDFEYMTCAGEAILVRYAGSDARLTLPDVLGGCPLTEIGSHAFDRYSAVAEVVLPESVTAIYADAFRTGTKIDAYIPNSDAVLAAYSFACYDEAGKRLNATLHGPAGGALEEFAAQNAEDYAFVPTDEMASAKSAEKLMGDVRAAAALMGENVVAFWDKFDHEKYAWFARVPEYEMTAPEALAVVRLTPGQYAPFVAAFTDANGFAKSVNAQYDADYTQASLMTNVAFTGESAPDGMCAVVLLVYQTDILFFAEDEAGNVTAAMIVSATDIANSFSAEYVETYAAQLGIGDVEVEIFGDADAADMLAAND